MLVALREIDGARSISGWTQLRAVENVSFEKVRMNPVIKIGMLGMGTVGTGVVKFSPIMEVILKTRLTQDRAEINLSVTSRKRSVDVSNLLTTNPEDILEDPGIDIVVEVMGTIDTAFEYILRAFENKKAVVTATRI